MRAPRSSRRPLPWRGITAVGAVVAVLVVALLPSPYAVERPGPVFDVLGASGTGKDRRPLISIPEETTYPTGKGRLDLLTVSVLGSPSGGPSWIDLALAWVNPTQAVVPLESVFPAGTTLKQNEQQSAADMTASQRSAVAAALTQLGDRVEGDVRIATVGRGTAAAGVLEPGDVVVSYDGEAVDDSCALQNDVIAGGTRRSSIVVERDGARRTLEVEPRAVPLSDGSTRPLLGVATTASFDFPFEVDIRIEDVGGPSAGMMFALGVIDKLTPGSLTGGRHVAGTGTICGDGAVGPIGGIRQKMAAARAAGATLFLAPEGNCDEVAGHVPAGLDVVPVKTLAGALDALEHVRERGSAQGLPTCSAPVSSAG
ncbi:PDZ domain-containing protein [Amnibacterium endophyticum]|uniref:endopeptidase La n=1 Tax=Amnibacterium endophyticum TaxID=2109337 RepID=A0ABW4LBY1_9MICO